MTTLVVIVAGAFAVAAIVEIAAARSYVRWMQADSVNANEAEGPKAAVVVCVRGPSPTLDECLSRLAEQRYEDFELRLVVDHESDPACESIERWQRSHSDVPLSVEFLRDPSPSAYLKTSALRQCLMGLPGDIAAVVMADADALVYPDWLHDMTAPFADPRVGLVTGNRWYDPTAPGWGSIARYVVNAICVPAMRLMRATWAGSLSMTRGVFDDAALHRTLTDTSSEEAAIQESARRAGQTIEVQPSVMILNRESCTLANCFEFFRRQLVWTRLYHPAWGVLLAAVAALHLFFAITFVESVLLAVNGRWTLAATLWAALGGQIVLAAILVSWLHAAIAARARRRQGIQFPAITWAALIRIGAAVPLGFILLSYAFFAAAMARKVRWSGVTYVVVPPRGLKMVDYRPYREIRAANRRRLRGADRQAFFAGAAHE